MVRVFGVQRTKHFEKLNIRNKMTGRIFFLRYPKLFDFFLRELQIAALKIKTEKYRRLHPILLLLSRLYPSSLEGSESSLKLSEALPFIIACSSCPELQTRILIAKSIVALVPINQIHGHILETLNQLKINNLSSNLRHSLLLHILHLIDSAPDEIKFSIQDVNLLIFDLQHIFSCNNLIVLATYLNVILELILRIKRCDSKFEVSQEVAESLTKHLNKVYNECQSNLIGVPDILPPIAVLRSILNKVSFRISLKSSDEIEYVNTILNILILIFSDDDESELYDYFEISFNEIRFVNIFLNNESKQMHRLNLLKNIEFTTMLCEIASNSANFNLSIKAMTIISSSYILISQYLNEKDTKKMFLKLIDLSQDKMDQNKIPLFKMINTVVLNRDTNAIPFDVLPQLILKSILPDNHDQLREIATHILINCLKENRKLYHNINIIRSIVILLRDDDVHIRNLISQVMTSYLRRDSNHTLRAFYLQKLFINEIGTRWLHGENKIEIALLLLMIAHQEYKYNDANEFIEDENDFRIKVFDKNEVNVFGERNQVIWEIFREIQKMQITDYKLLIDCEFIKKYDISDDQILFFKGLDFKCENVKMWIPCL